MTISPPPVPVPTAAGQSPLAWPKAAWLWLTAPSPHLVEQDQRRQAQLLSSLLVIIIPLLLLTETSVLFLLGRDMYRGYALTLGVAALLLIAYALSRTTHHAWAAVLTNASAAVGVIAFGIATPAAVFTGILSWLLIPLLLASAFLPIRQWVLFWLASLAGLLLFPILLPVVTFTQLAINTFPFVVMSGAVVLLLTHHRDQLERDRAGSIRRAEMQARQEATRTAALLRVAERLNSTLDLEAVLATLCAETTLALAADAAIVYLYDDAQAVLLLTASHGLPVGSALPAPISRAVHDQAVASLGSVAVLPTGLPLAGLPDAGAFGLPADSAAYATLAHKGDLVGSLFVIRHTPNQLITEDERLLLRGLADQAALAIVNTQLYKDARRRLDRLQALRTIDIAITNNRDIQATLDVLLEQITHQLGVDAALVLLLDAAEQRLVYAAGIGFRTRALRATRLRLGDGRAGQVALQRRILAVPDLAADLGGFAHAPLIGQEGFASYFAAPLVAKDDVYGVLEVFHRTRLTPNLEWLDFLEALAGQTAIAIDNSTLLSDLQRSHANLASAYDATIEGWSRALDLRDKETEGHTQRVTQTTLQLARAMGLGEGELTHLRRGALLHDIGKMGIPDRILLKPGPLTEDEWVMMRRHPQFAYDMLAPIAYLRPALDIPYCHHEKWDGTGYPRQLKADEIPLAARIFAVVDVWDALRSDRPYRPAWPKEKVFGYLRDQAGNHFDPQVVTAFLRLMHEG